MLLDFEKPISLLENRLATLRLEDTKENNKENINKAIQRLESEILILKNEVYSNLTNWQKFKSQDIHKDLILLII